MLNSLHALGHRQCLELCHIRWVPLAVSTEGTFRGRSPRCPLAKRKLSKVARNCLETGPPCWLCIRGKRGRYFGTAGWVPTSKIDTSPPLSAGELVLGKLPNFVRKCPSGRGRNL